MARMSGKQLGQWGENLAAKYLVQSGYTVLKRNFRTPYGEIDMIAQKGEITVFVEVKTRSSQAFGYPEEAITDNKRIHLIEASQSYLQEHSDSDVDWRIDVIAIQYLGDNQEPKIEHFENAVH
jgi:putative endonuclease